MGKGIWLIEAVEAVEFFDEWAARTVIGSQGETSLERHLAACPQIGEDIAASEAVDGLLGIANQKETAGFLRTGIREDRVKDAELDSVGVLELIDECERERLRMSCLSISLRIAQSLFEFIEQVVKRHETIPLFRSSSSFLTNSRPS